MSAGGAQETGPGKGWSRTSRGMQGQPAQRGEHREAFQAKREHREAGPNPGTAGMRTARQSEEMATAEPNESVGGAFSDIYGEGATATFPNKQQTDWFSRWRWARWRLAGWPEEPGRRTEDLREMSLASGRPSECMARHEYLRPTHCPMHQGPRSRWPSRLWVAPRRYPCTQQVGVHTHHRCADPR